MDQSWTEKEVIVVDDGSTDGSLEVIRSFGNAIRFETGPNRGGNVARNRLLDLARGEWLQYLDADDYLLPQKIERQFSEFDPAACDVAYSPVILLHCEGDQEPWEEFREIPEPRDLWIKLVRMELPQTAAPLWRKSALLDVGKWKADQPCCQELELYFRLLIGRKRFAYCPTAGVHYRQWSTQTVWRKNPMQTLGRWLAIIDAAELHLQQQGRIEREARRDAIALAALRCSCPQHLSIRTVASAQDLAKKAKRNHPRFSLLSSNDFPRSYRWAHHLVGFGLAERIAEITRPLKRQRGLQTTPAKPSVDSSRRTTGDRASETAGVIG